MNVWGTMMNGEPEEVVRLLTGDGSGELAVGQVACATANAMNRVDRLATRLDEVEAAYGRTLAENTRTYGRIARLFGRIKRLEKEAGIASYALGDGLPATDGEL